MTAAANGRRNPAVIDRRYKNPAAPPLRVHNAMLGTASRGAINRFSISGNVIA